MGAFFIIRMLSAMFQANQLPAEDIIPRKNSLGVYFGFFEGNINYERNILVFPHSYWNLRAGWGQWTNMQAEGDIYNLSLIYIMGKRISHLEVNAGVKYIHGEVRDGHSTLYPDIFIGYRVEKPDGRLFLRAGLNSLSVFNLGAGIKF